MHRDNSKTDIIVVRMKPDEKQLVANHAKQNGLSLSAYVTACILFSAPSAEFYRIRIYNELHNRIIASPGLTNKEKQNMIKELENIYEDNNNKIH